MIAQRGSFWTPTLRGQQRADSTLSGEVDEGVRNNAPGAAVEAQHRLIRSYDHAPRWMLFLSHSGGQKEAVVRFMYDEMNRRDITTFLDDVSLRGGDDSPVVMRTALQTCRVVIFVLTPEFAAKKATMQELKLALQLQELQQRPTIIPVFYGLTVEDCIMGKALFWKYRTTFGNPNFFVRKLQKLFGCSPKFNFYDRVDRGETSEREVLDALRAVCRFSGVYNRLGAHQVVADTVQELVGQVSAGTGTIVTDNPDERGLV